MSDQPPCPHMTHCEMYSLFNYAGTLAVWKIRYCTADYTACARYQNALRNQQVPVNLMPNGALLRKAAGEVE